MIRDERSGSNKNPFSELFTSLRSSSLQNNPYIILKPFYGGTKRFQIVCFDPFITLSSSRRPKKRFFNIH